MKYFSTIFAVLFSINLSFSQKQKVKVSSDGKCIESNWKLDFEDDFNAKEIDKNKWKTREDCQGTTGSDGTEEYYSFDNVELKNGICKLIPKKETIVRKAVNWKPDSLILEDGIINTRTFHYTSAWLVSKQNFSYGKYEIRCKIPKGKSLWPAFWLYGEYNKVNNEIDVFEFWNPHNGLGKYIPKNLAREHHMTAHHNHKMSGKSYIGPDFSLDYHIFTVIWDSTKVEWYVDGDLKRVITQYQTKHGKNVACKDVKANHTYYINSVIPKDPM
ncbi:MAG: glycoside hydrolase family 16 protein, partial [Bacteroidia bacterium]